MSPQEPEEPAWRRDVPPWRIETLEKKVDALNDRGDRRHDETNKAMSEIASTTRMLSRVVEDSKISQERSLRDLRETTEKALASLAKDQEDAKLQNEKLLRAILWLAGLVVAAGLSVAFNWLQSVTTLRAHAESPTIPFESPGR